MLKVQKRYTKEKEKIGSHMSGVVRFRNLTLGLLFDGVALSFLNN